MEIILKNEEINSIKNLKCINFGKSGKIFRDKDIVYKLLTFPLNKVNIETYGSKSELIAYPNDLLFNKEGKYIGYTMDYKPGYDLRSGFNLKTDLDKLVLAYLKLEKELKKLIEYQMIDMCSLNIMYDDINNNFYLVDTDEWLLNYFSYYNIEIINNILLKVLNISNPEINSFIDGIDYIKSFRK